MTYNIGAGSAISSLYSGVNLPVPNLGDALRMPLPELPTIDVAMMVSEMLSDFPSVDEMIAPMIESLSSVSANLADIHLAFLESVAGITKTPHLETLAAADALADIGCTFDLDPLDARNESGQGPLTPHEARSGLVRDIALGWSIMSAVDQAMDWAGVPGPERFRVAALILFAIFAMLSSRFLPDRPTSAA